MRLSGLIQPAEVWEKIMSMEASLISPVILGFFQTWLESYLFCCAGFFTWKECIKNKWWMNSTVKENKLFRINYSMSSPGTMLGKNDKMIQNGHIAISSLNGETFHLMHSWSKLQSASFHIHCESNGTFDLSRGIPKAFQISQLPM